MDNHLMLPVMKKVCWLSYQKSTNGFLPILQLSGYREISINQEGKILYTEI
jgi:hypothetical protein